MTHIQQRRDQAAVWTATDPVLYEGEAGHETDTGQWKLGDGVTPWTGLPYKAGVDSVSGHTGVVNLVVDDVAGAAPILSPVFTGSPTAPTPATSDDDTSIATTAFVKDVLANSPALGGTPTATTPATGDDDTSIATTAFVKAVIAEMMLEMHPIDSLYFTATNINPGTFLGGTWVAFGSGRVLVGVDAAQAEFDTAGETGGSKTHTLAASELPDHFHELPMADSGGASGFNDAPQRGSVSISGTGSFRILSDKIAASATFGSGLIGNQPHNNLQPYITGYMWRRTV